MSSALEDISVMGADNLPLSSSTMSAAQARQAWLTVAICTSAYMLAYLDRQVLSLLIEPVKADLHVTDTQFGLLNGLAFALFYATMGIPIAASSDHGNRSRIIAAGLFVWSVATMLCGLARSFGMLFLARLGVGAGEACIIPASYSLIADLFPKERLGRALSVFATGNFIGSGLAFLGGGWIISMVVRHPLMTVPGMVHLKAWQMAFLAAGAPGVLLTLVVMLYVKEPRSLGLVTPRLPNRGFIDVLRYMRQRGVVFFSLIIGYSFAAMALFSLMAWAPAYLIRTFHLDAHICGYWMGAAVICGCTPGVLVSGGLVDAMRRRGYVESPFTAGIAGAIGVACTASFLPLIHSFSLAITVLVLSLFFAAFALPPSATGMQVTGLPWMRARITATFLFCNSLFGLALGSYLVGMLNDRVFHSTGKSLALVVAGAAIIQIAILVPGTPALRRQLLEAEAV